MTRILLLVIYLSFISLGLPDTLLGAAWPVMRADLGAELDAAGAVSLVISLGTVVSCLLSGRLLRRFGTGPVAFFSVLLTAGALLGFSWSGSLPCLLALAVPLGLGAGAVDSGLNNFVALHCRPCHMNFLHCFWGLGAMSGPAIMSFWIARGSQWPLGFRTVSGLQFLLALALALSLPLWKRPERAGPAAEEEETPPFGGWAALGLPGVKASLAAFFCCCALENAAGLWASSYLSECRCVPAEVAALCASLFYGGIAIGRCLAGFLSGKLSAALLIRWGQYLCAAGALLLLFHLPLPAAVTGLWLFGLGCAPLYPALLQQTPARFGRQVSQAVMGLQVASAYLGSTVVPPALGLLVQHTTIAILPWFLLLALGLMALLCRRLAHREKNG